MNTSFGVFCVAMLTGVAVSPAALAQSNELGVLAGATNPSASVNVASLASVSAGTSVSVLVDFAHRLKETSTGKLWLEFPAARVWKASVGINPERLNVTQSKFFFTPGLRYAILPQGRVSPYVAGGFGFGWFDSVHLVIDNPLVFNLNVSQGIKPAAGFGGGAEVRISRLFSFRAEVRDFVNCAGGMSPRNHVVFNGGFGLRF